MVSTLAIPHERTNKHESRTHGAVHADAQSTGALFASFDSLLGAVKHSRNGGSSPGIQPVEAQMFEAPEVDPAQRRDQIRRQEHRRAIQATEDPRAAQRRDAAHDAPGIVAPTASDVRPASTNAPGLWPSSGALPSDVSRNPQSGSQWSEDRLSQGRGATLASQLFSTGRAETGAAPSANQSPFALMSPSAATNATAGASAAAPTPTVSASEVRSQEGNVAQQVGRLLAASRSPGDATFSSTGSATGNQPRSDSADALRRQSESTPTQRQAAASADQDGKITRATTSDFDALIRAVRLRPGAQHSSARLHLDPPELGRILVDVRMKADELSITVRTENAEACRLLDARAGHLKSALEQAGIPVERFDVFADLNHADHHARESTYAFGNRGDAHGRAGSSQDAPEGSDPLAEKEEFRDRHEVWSMRRLGMGRLDVRV